MKAIPLHANNLLRSVALLGILVPLCGCRVTQHQIEHRHWDLNDSVRRTHTEQLLLNIVRLRYDDTPYFLQVSSVSSQFSAGQNANVSGTIPDGGAAVLGLGGSISYSESPVVTWSLPDSREFMGRLMAPMGADQLTVLAQSGYDPQRVLRAGIKKINSLRNMDFTVEQGLVVPGTYDQFIEVLKLIQELRNDDLVDLAYGVKSTMGAGKIPLEKLDTRAIPQGLQYGLQFMTREDPDTFEPLKLSKPLFLRFSKASDDDQRAQRVRELLNLDSAKYSFGIVDTGNSGTEQLLSESGKLSQVFDPQARLSEIVLNNRSMMEVLYLASTYVQAPEEQVARGYVRARPPATSDTDWLRINVSSSEPDRTWLKVKSYGHWFYIAADDVATRETFALLDALFASVVGNVPGAKPLLTLPVN